jgi:hypothetical protein
MVFISSYRIVIKIISIRKVIMYSKKLVVRITFLSILTTLSLASAQAAPSPKKLTVGQAEKKIRSAIERTIRWQNTNPFTVSTTIEEGSRKTLDAYTIDKAGIVRIADSEGTIVIEIGEYSYVPFVESAYPPFEIDIARKIGLDLKLKWVKVGSVTVNDKYEPDFSRDQARSITKPNMTMFESIYPNRSTITSTSSGKIETIKVSTKAFADAKWGTVPSSSLTFTITDGKLTSYNFKSKGVLTSISYKSFKGLLNPPPAPILIWSEVLKHPDYVSLKTDYSSQVTLG